MAIVKANYTRQGSVAKASVRYIENRPGKDGARGVRTIFNADGKVGRADVYTMIDQADNNSYFFRLVISPDPKRTDRDKSLSHRQLTKKSLQSLEDRFEQPLHWVSAIQHGHT